MQKSLQTGHVPSQRIIDEIDYELGSQWPWPFPKSIYDDPSPLAPIEKFWDPDDLRKMIRPDGRTGGWIEFDLADKLLCCLHLTDSWRGRLEDIYLEVNLDPVEKIETVNLRPTESLGVCARSECDNVFPAARTGRPRKYCSNRCRQMARVKKAPEGRVRCARVGCTTEFTPRARARHQKYCSTNCAFAEQRARRAKRKGETFVPRGPKSHLARYRCKNGHEREEQTKPWGCEECRRESNARYRAANREKLRQWQSDHRAKKKVAA